MAPEMTIEDMVETSVTAGFWAGREDSRKGIPDSHPSLSGEWTDWLTACWAVGYKIGWALERGTFDAIKKG